MMAIFSFHHLLLVNILLASYLTGLIFVIQFVHYPSFKFIEEKNFLEFEKFHVQKISLIVMAPMILELISSIIMACLFPSFPSILSFICVFFIWASTIFLSVPLHEILKSKKCEKTIQKLILTNWPRAIFWPIRLLVLIIIFFQGR